MPSFTLTCTLGNSDMPVVLYHGSGYKQKELKPGYLHTKKLTVWDKYESNSYLYATSDEESAKLLGISSAWEKKYELTTTKLDEVNKTIYLKFEGKPPKLEELADIRAFLYTINYKSGVWIKNNNPFNKIVTEYKTKETIRDILECIQLDVADVLKDYTITIE